MMWEGVVLIVCVCLYIVGNLVDHWPDFRKKIDPLSGEASAGQWYPCEVIKPNSEHVLFWVVRDGVGCPQLDTRQGDRITHWAKIYQPRPTVSTSPCPECGRK